MISSISHPVPHIWYAYHQLLYIQMHQFFIQSGPYQLQVRVITPLTGVITTQILFHKAIYKAPLTPFLTSRGPSCTNAYAYLLEVEWLHGDLRKRWEAASTWLGSWKLVLERKRKILESKVPTFCCALVVVDMSVLKRVYVLDDLGFLLLIEEIRLTTTPTK